ncbi:hypothetical protein Csa_007883 [Cucumis sativus]|nr:hypothetical protein Csa_007883 [Cucumis sativus]
MKLTTIYCSFHGIRNLVSCPSKHAFGFQFRCWRSAAEGDIVHFRTEDIDNDYLLESRTISSRGHLRRALSLFYSSKQPHSHQTYAYLFHVCARLRCLQEGVGLHRYMLSQNPMVSFDLFVTNHLINMYCKCGHLDYANQLFNEMPRRNYVSWTVLITGFSQYGHVDECFLIFSRMLVDHRPNEFTVSSLLTSFGEHDGERGRQIHGFALKISLDAFVYVANALITMYSKICSEDGAFKDSKDDDAWTMFKSMENPSLITWNSMIAGFCFRKLGHQAIYLFMQMNRHGIGFDRATLVSTLSSTSFCNRDEFGRRLSFCHQIHCQALKTAFISEVEIITALVKTYAELGGDIADSYRLFVEAGYNRDIVLWTSIMAAFIDHDPGKTLSLFCQFRQEGLTPDGHTFSIVLKACAGFLTEKHASTYHSLLIKSMSEDHTVLNNALIHAYGRCGSISSSKKVFNQMKHHDLVSWNTMMKAYALHGQAEIALQLFTKMNVPPDATTFVSLLSACSHAGLVEEGTSLFNSITNYGIVCRLDHYACMVDILGRSGQVQEAHDFISNMPIEPDFVVWSSFLGSCRKYGATGLAKLASYKLKELDPSNSLAYVQMSISMWSLPAIGCWYPCAFARFRVFCASSQLPLPPKDETLRTIHNSGVIACLRASSAELAMSAACAALNGGISVLEIVMSTPGVLEVLQQLLQDYPTKTLGVGTVLNIKDAKNAVKAGAKFLMSPTMVKGIIMGDIEGEFLYIPGVMTPTEVLTAYESGSEIVKVYPVSALGGIKYISALKKPFPHISMVASQGITIGQYSA